MGEDVDSYYSGSTSDTVRAKQRVTVTESARAHSYFLGDPGER